MTSAQLSIADLNDCSREDFVAAIGPIYEHGDWIADATAPRRPFASLTELLRATAAVLAAAPDDAAVALLRGHPALQPGVPPTGLTSDSAREQRSAQLAAWNEATAARLAAANVAFSERFGFPFIIAVRDASPATVLAAVQRRLTSSPAAERAEALREVEAIAWLRLLDRVRPAPTGALSLHVLDTARARPAACLVGELRQGAARLASFRTDEAGRAGSFLADGALRAGPYEWLLDTAAYFAAAGMPTWDRSFLPTVTVRFAVWNPEQHHHVPVLLTPGSYTTYRGA